MNRRRFLTATAAGGLVAGVGLMPERLNAQTTSPSGYGIFNVRDYGATGNGSSDDTSAIQGAINAAVAASRGCVYFPSGNYIISQALSLPSSLPPAFNIILQGEGPRISTIIQNGANCNGLNLEFPTGSARRYSTIIVSGIRIACNAGHSAGSAIVVRYLGDGNPGDILGCQLAQIEVNNYTDSSYWQTGILIDNVIHLSVSDLSITGRSDGGPLPSGTIGLCIRHSAIYQHYRDFTIMGWDVGILIQDGDYDPDQRYAMQGLYFTNPEVVAINIGMNVMGKNVGGDYLGIGPITISGGVFDVNQGGNPSGTRALNLVNCNGIQITNVTIGANSFEDDGSHDPCYYIYLNQCFYSNFSNLFFWGGIPVGILFANGAGYNTLTNCTWSYTPAGIRLVYGCGHNIIRNFASGGIINVIDDGHMNRANPND